MIEYSKASQRSVRKIGLRNAKHRQSQHCRDRLNEQYPTADGICAVDAGDDHTDQEEYLDLEPEGDVGLHQSPNQARGEKAVIKPLVRSEHGRVSCLFYRITENPQTERLRPKEHFERQKINMQDCDQR